MSGHPPRSLLTAVWLLLAALLLPAAPASGQQQSTEQALGERRLEYDAARTAYEAARSALRVLSAQFQLAQNDVNRARLSGDEAALERAYARAYDRAIPYGAQEERVREQNERLVTARRALIEILAIRLDQLIEEMNDASSSAERAQLNAIWNDLDHEMRDLESESETGLRIDPTVMPEITFDPRDVPADRLLKAEILERRAASIDTTIMDVDRRIKVINDRIRMQRQRADLMAGVTRFDDTQLPVTTGTPAGDRALPAAADSVAVRSEPVSLEAQLERLRDTREQLIQYRDEHLVRARVFRESIRSVAS